MLHWRPGWKIKIWKQVLYGTFKVKTMFLLTNIVRRWLYLSVRESPNNFVEMWSETCEAAGNKKKTTPKIFNMLSGQQTNVWNDFALWIRLVHLQREHHQGNADEDDHQQLGGPDLGRDVPVAHRGEGNDAEIECVEQRQLFPGSFQMLDSTSSAGREWYGDEVAQYQKMSQRQVKQT